MARLVAAGTAGSGGETGDAHTRQRRHVEVTIAALRELRRGITLDLPLREAIEAGRD